MSVLAAERIKLTSTRSPWWCGAIVVLLGIGFAAAMGLAAKASVNSTSSGDHFLPTPEAAASGVTGFGVMVIMIMAALAVTTEYRFGVIRTTFQAVPNRGRVMATKAAILAVIAAVLTAAVTFIAYFLAKALSGSDAGRDLVLSSGGDWRALYGVPIYAALCAVLAVGVGALIRQSAGAIALLVLWPLVIENLFALFGRIGRDIQVFLPFTNAHHFLGASSSDGFHWGPWGGLIYFAVFVAVVFGAGLFVVNKRDA
ncbi:ABC transporter permease [Rhodococcus sp. D2-41]|uniref:ABC transporter permease n=1 Tax=Speluncibacter jeojiensis TaxID=2710754 RepID=A0A9X4M1F5_9ACTN|nr:ABC transporter permease [Rhodococcus sp. D2-41]MDG3010051.1 ABC transporter permease [Rhodococcus sp. D2-41]MDG3016245.1 ABC transporter permease [Corynebacteriales bacterium D3-21]